MSKKTDGYVSMPRETYPPKSPEMPAEVVTKQWTGRTPAEPPPAGAARPHPGVTVVSPAGARTRYALRYRVGERVRQPQLGPGTTAEDARAAACALSLLLRLGFPLGADAAPAPERRASPGAHRGVQVLPPRPGRPVYSLRYTDPATRRVRQHRLRGVTSAEVAQQAARRLHESLQSRSVEITSAGGERGIAITLTDEISGYLAAARLRVNRHGLPTSAVTLANYARALERFRAWCAARPRPITLLSQLTRPALDEYRAARVAAPAHNRARAMSSVNHEIKPVRQMLLAAVGGGRLVHLRSEAIGDTLRRLTEARPQPRCLSAPEIRATLRAALQLDADRGGEPLGAAMVAVGLLTGLRRRELVELRAGDIVFDAPTEYDPTVRTGADYIQLGRGRTKTGAPRKVATTTFSPLLGELLGALVERRARAPRLFKLGYRPIEDYVWRLRALGAPSDLNIKMLRSTCATCQRPLPGDLKTKADRQGHTLTVAETYYLSAPTGLPVSAPDLDAVMQCTDELRAIIGAVRVG